MSSNGSEGGGSRMRAEEMGKAAHEAHEGGKEGKIDFFSYIYVTAQ
jgi:hypothetical protein